MRSLQEHHGCHRAKSAAVQSQRHTRSKVLSTDLCNLHNLRIVLATRSPQASGLQAELRVSAHALDERTLVSSAYALQWSRNKLVKQAPRRSIELVERKVLWLQRRFYALEHRRFAWRHLHAGILCDTSPSCTHHVPMTHCDLQVRTQTHAANALA